ncbi:MAG: 1,4-dihydroxy-2-naphthoate polyprenyltransferase [Chloroflexota bacterium]|nr:1,4-dihydroxy-2-naphthoate polyprenyltransferase [Chloroflexota bacterium]
MPPPPRPAVSLPGAWLMAARPKTLPAAVAPVVVGTAVAIAEDGAHVPSVVAAVAVALLLQIAANFANDLFDHRRGADSPDRVGPARVVSSGLISERQVAVATGVVLAGAMVAGLALVIRGGWPILVLGLLAMVAAVAYTGGPAPLGYLGLGDVFVFAFFGLVAVAGTAYVQTQDLTGLALLAAVPMGCFATAILVVNNLRDVDGDRLVGKKTLAVRYGVKATRVEYTVLVVVAFLAPPVLWAAGLLSAWWWMPWLTTPLAALLVQAIWTERGPALNLRLAGTARLQLLWGCLFAVSMIL